MIPATRVSRPKRTGSRTAVSAGRSAGDALAADLRPPLTAQHPALVLGRSAPNAVLLVGGDRELETGIERRARPAERLRGLDLFDGHPGDTDREKEIWVEIPAGGVITPVQVVPVVADRCEQDFLRLWLDVCGMPRQRVSPLPRRPRARGFGDGRPHSEHMLSLVRSPLRASRRSPETAHVLLVAFTTSPCSAAPCSPRPMNPR